jgi:hypothetical protein
MKALQAFAFFGVLILGCVVHLLSFFFVGGDGRELYNLQDYSIPGIVFFILYYTIIICLAYIAADDVE